MELPPLRREVQRQLLEVVRDGLAGGDLDHRRHGDAVVVPGMRVLVGVPQVLETEHGVAVVRVVVEAPAPLVVHGARDAERDRRFQAQQTTHDLTARFAHGHARATTRRYRFGSTGHGDDSSAVIRSIRATGLRSNESGEDRTAVMTATYATATCGEGRNDRHFWL